MWNDHKLQAAVQERLDLDPAINSSHIGVSAREGIVTLSGHVPNLLDRTAAAQAAGLVKGVKAVVDELRVELPGEHQTADEHVAEQAYARLASNASVPPGRIHLVVQDAVVTLYGDVDWHFQRQAAIDDLSRLSCVRGIKSDVQIKPPVEGTLVEKKIHEALQQIAPLDADRITVQAEGSCVTLVGEVTSWHEKGIAETAAWSVPGVSQVTNNITVV